MRTRGNILGQDQIGVSRSCVRTGSDMLVDQVKDLEEMKMDIGTWVHN